MHAYALGPTAAISLALLVGACSSGHATSPPLRGGAVPADAGASSDDGGQAAVDAGSSGDAGADVDSGASEPAGLPFPYVRPEAGDPVPAADLAAMTDTYVDLLTKTRYFDVLDERLHGWPQTDPQGRYWFGTWWSGTGIRKAAGAITYFHLDAGAENNGQRTAPILDGTCFATKLWGLPRHEALTRRMMRGFTAWMMAMERQPNDPAGPILARTHYPASITSHDNGRDIVIDYAADRPGAPGGGGGFVHIPNNPYWGDIWVENVRSKDDIGHMLLAIGALADCSAHFGDPATTADYADLLAHYTAWARKVEDDGWAIATLDENDQPYIPTGDLAHFFNFGGSECPSQLALRLFGRQDPGKIACGNGVTQLDLTFNSDAIVHSFHQAAVSHALLAKQNTAALALLTGLTSRIEDGLTAWEAGKPTSSEEQLSVLIALSSTLGVPLTWREVRYVHQMITKAHDAYVTQRQAWEYNLFDSSAPDGSFPFEPPGFGFRWVALALPIGSCVARFINPTTHPMLDCARLKANKP